MDNHVRDSNKSVSKVRILIADDHPLVREALKNRLEKEPDFEVVGEADYGELAVKLAAELNPDVVIMDITMPKLDGLEATRRIKTDNPDIAILALTVHDNEEVIIGVIEAGAEGYLTKTVFGAEIVPTIRAIVAGEMVLSPGISEIFKYVSQRPYPTGLHSNAGLTLTPRELAILKLVAKGATNKDIAQKLDLSVPTVKGHLLAIFSKLGVQSRTEAIIAGLRMGIFGIEDLEKKDSA